MKRFLFAPLIPIALALLSGCGIFGDDDELGPAPLVDFEPSIRTETVWDTNVGNGQGDKYNLLRPAIDGQQLFAASSNGIVVAHDRSSGERLWRVRLDDRQISGGVGASRGLVLLGTVNSSVIALSQETGEVLWETTVASEVLAPPQTNGRIVVAQSIDGTLTGLDAASGERRWLYESTVPALSLRGTSTPLIVENFVFAALANGSVISVALDNGTLRWEQRVALPTGVSEIDRLVDIDGDLLVNEGMLLVPSYQGYLAALDAVTGQVRWRVSDSSYHGPAFGFGNVYLSDDQSVVKAYRVGQDRPLWTNEQLLRRGLGAPVSFGNYVAVADFDGYVHFLSQVNGSLAGRTRIDRRGVRAPMLVRGNLLYVFGNRGELVALRVR